MARMHPGYKDMKSSKETGLPPLYKRLICGSICGIIGSLFANPTELIKCRLQCAGATASGHSYRYGGAFDAFRKIIKSEGVLGLWNGAGVFAMRNALGSAANLSTFSALKEYALHYHEDSIMVDTLSGLGSGFITSCVMCPLDMIKTRMQNQPIDPVTGRGKLYRSADHAILKIVRNEGVLALWKGFSSLFVRTGPHYVLTFTIYGLLQRWTTNSTFSDV
eukprot:CAMPEP_0167775242 /NCGR_PEP_ID=MMETSP0111_2-20121227/2444_1 /TAXON_ID=91324 /ORGANISM="Lotharella globosa, Strain CCCM811" /LENGTH=219 /DNA_ID=CAMNT_0007665123 /DNA_START=411 /DNA_END=1070 /DNA_ORIENTATION=+